MSINNFYYLFFLSFSLKYKLTNCQSILLSSPPPPSLFISRLLLYFYFFIFYFLPFAAAIMRAVLPPSSTKSITSLFLCWSDTPKIHRKLRILPRAAALCTPVLPCSSLCDKSIFPLVKHQRMVSIFCYQINKPTKKKSKGYLNIN